MSDWKQIVRQHLAPLRLPPEREIEIVEELAQHLEAVYEDALSDGATEPEARARALRVIADGRVLECELSRVERPLAARAAVEWIERRGGMRMESLWQDLRYGTRMLLKQPGFTLIAIITLALGIGANTAIFSVVNAVLLRPLAFKEPDRLVAVWERNLKKPDGEKSFVGGANFSDWKRQSQSFDALAAYMNWNYNLTGDGEPQRLRAIVATGDLFRALGVEPALGRTFAPDDDQDGRDNVVVLSHAFWQSRFGANREIVGQTVTLNNGKHTVIGVMPAWFEFPDARTEIWRPMAMSAEQAQNRQGKWLRVIGRLKAGVSPEQASAEMNAIAGRLERQYPEANGGWGASLLPLHEEVAGKVRRLMWILLGAVGFVLLIACANVANLLLARAASRQKEMAVRSALGANRVRLLSQFLIESLLLAALGGAAGLLLARWCSEALIALSPGGIPRLSESALDARVLGFTLLLALLATLLCGLIPAWQASKPDLDETLKEGGRGATGHAGRRWRSALVVAEVAAGVVLLVGAGLMVRSFLKLQQVNAGFDPRNLLTMQIMLPAGKYARNEQQIAFFQQTLEKIKTLPGVQSAGAVQDLPLRLNATSFPVTIPGRPAVAENERPMAVHRTVSDDYPRTMGIPLLRGRAFTPRDDLNAPPVVIINQTMARRLWPDEDPVGKQLRFGAPEDPPYTIVGVAGDIKHMGLAGEEGAVIYQPHAQKRFAWLRWMAIVVRTDAEALSLAAAIRRRVQEVDRDQPVYEVATMEELLAKSVAEPRFTTLLVGGFALLALGLAALGIYGVVSFAVVQRTHEIGIRVALGAQVRDVLALVIRQGMTLALLGVALGLAGAFALTRLIESLLFGVTTTDPLTFIGVSALLPIVALAACWIPARRAAKVDPLVALRCQ